MSQIEALEWPSKRVAEKFTNAADWSPVLESDTIATCSAEVISGVVTIESDDQFDAAIQAVRVSGGEPGVVTIRCTINTTTNQDKFTQDYIFGILP